MLLSCGQRLGRGPQRAQTARRGCRPSSQPPSQRLRGSLRPDWGRRTLLGAAWQAPCLPVAPQADLQGGPAVACVSALGVAGFTLSPAQLGTQELQGVGPTWCPFHPRSTLRKPGKRRQPGAQPGPAAVGPSRSARLPMTRRTGSHGRQGSCCFLLLFSHRQSQGWGRLLVGKQQARSCRRSQCAKQGLGRKASFLPNQATAEVTHGSGALTSRPSGGKEVLLTQN